MSYVNRLRQFFEHFGDSHRSNRPPPEARGRQKQQQEHGRRSSSGHTSRVVIPPTSLPSPQSHVPTSPRRPSLAVPEKSGSESSDDAGNTHIHHMAHSHNRCLSVLEARRIFEEVGHPSHAAPIIPPPDRLKHHHVPEPVPVPGPAPLPRGRSVTTSASNLDKPKIPAKPRLSRSYAFGPITNGRDFARSKSADELDQDEKCYKRRSNASDPFKENEYNEPPLEKSFEDITQDIPLIDDYQSDRTSPLPILNANTFAVVRSLGPSENCGDKSGLESRKRLDETYQLGLDDTSDIPEDGEVVVLRLKTEESLYDRRTKYQSVFKDAPLYQIYDKQADRRESLRAMGSGHRESTRITEEDEIMLSLDETAENDFQEIDAAIPIEDGIDKPEEENLIGRFAGTGPNRTMWADMPEVVESGLLSHLNHEERSLQEAQFELITSEASYYRSLNVLINNFYKSEEFSPNSTEPVITALQKHHLFSNILEIHITSESLLHALETRWREQSPQITDICDVVFEHADTKFSAYVTYVKNQPYQIQTLRKLLPNHRFSETVGRLQKRAECGLLDLNSFLLLPMQRVTRLRLLVRNLLDYLKAGEPNYTSALIALAALEKILKECDRQKTHMEQKERIMNICNIMDFKANVKTVSIGDRTLVKEGDLKVLDIGKAASTAFKKSLFGSRQQVPATLFLFNNVLLIAKKKKNGRYSVEDACPMEDLEVGISGSCGGGDVCPVPAGHSTFYGIAASGSVAAEGHFPFRLTLRAKLKSEASYGLEAKTINERARWMDALCPKKFVDEDRDYETWDCSQVIVSKAYCATQADELDLKEGDMLNVLIKLTDGWYKGVLPDGKEGWLLAKNTVEVENEEVKRRNMKKFYLSDEALKAYNQFKEHQKQSGAINTTNRNRNAMVDSFPS